MDTPILFLIFNRPDVTQRVFEAIKKQKPSKLYIAADGPRTNKDGEARLCEETRNVVLTIDWPCEVKTLYRNENLGCKVAVSSAIDWFFEQEEEGIILEDDCLPNEDFFRFCATMLEYYRDDNRIMHIGGTNFLDGEKIGNGSYYFSNIHHIWGWASWRRAWRKYKVDVDLFDQFREEGYLMDMFPNSFHQSFWIQIFGKIKTGELNTWDFQWLLSIWINNGLGIVPNKNLVSNIGFGDNATHTVSKASHILANRKVEDIGLIVHPLIFRPSQKAANYTMNTYLLGGVRNMIKLKIKTMLQKNGD